MGKIDIEDLHTLMYEFKNGDKNKFEQLYKKYNKLIYGIAFSILKNKENSEDVSQKVFLKIWNMDKVKLPLNNEASWLYTLTKNETLNFLKRIKKELPLDDIYFISVEDEYIDRLIDKDSYNKLISKLEKDEQEIVSLKILADMSFREIAEILNKPISTIQWKYYKSVSTLKILLSNLSMFIISLLVLFKKGNVKQNTVKEEETNVNNITLPTPSYDASENESKKENNSVEIENITTQNTIENNKINQISHSNNGIAYFSGFFLLFSIFFLIIFLKQLYNKNKLKKYQQNSNSKLSK